MLRPRRSQDARRQELDAGHHGGPLGDLVPRRPHVLDLRVRRLAEVVPDRRGAGDDVGLVAAVGDDVVRALLERHVLAVVVPADVHQLDGVEGALAAPRRTGGMRGLSLEAVLHRHEARAVAVAPRDAEVGAHVGEERDVDILEEPRAHEVRLRGDEFFRRPGPHADRAGQLVALHDLLDRDRGGDVERHAGVVPFTVSGSAGNQRIVVGDAGLLGRLRDAVDVGPEREHGLTRSPARHERGGNAGDPLLHREPVLPEDVDQVPIRLDFLEPELAEAEHGVHHLLREDLHAVHFGGGIGLQLLDPRIVLRNTHRRRRGLLLPAAALGHRGCDQHGREPHDHQCAMCHRLLPLFIDIDH